MATLTTQTITAVGLSPTYAAAGASGDKVHPGKGVFLHVKNAGVGSATVTIAAPGTLYGGRANPDLTVTVAATDDQMIPVPADTFADPADSGLAAVTYSDETDLTVAALRI